MQYTITVSAIVGQAKMKGVTLKAFLPPFPPQNLQCYPSEVGPNKTTSIKAANSQRLDINRTESLIN